MIGRAMAATKAQQHRFDIIGKHTGCLACLIEGFENAPADVQHLTAGFRRRGHDATIGLCPWHHRQVPVADLDMETMRHKFGPSFAAGRRPFAARYGSDDLLLELQNYAIQLYVLAPWPDHSMPRDVAHDIRARWRALWAVG